MTTVQPPVTPGGRFAKDRFAIDTEAGTVTCPAGVVAAMRPVKAGGQIAAFGAACAGCPLASACTNAKDGRRIRIGIYEPELVRARTAQAAPRWRAEYRATRPKVERKIGHLMRRRYGGRRARVRGQTKGRRRLLSTGCRGQPGPVWRARTHPGIRAQMGASPNLTRPGSPHHRPGNPCLWTPAKAHTSPETQDRPTNSRVTATACVTCSPHRVDHHGPKTPVEHQPPSRLSLLKGWV
jgi:hypothetical protein